MTTATNAPEAPTAPVTKGSHRRRWIVLAASLAAAVAAIVVGVVTWTGSSSAQAAELTRTANACRMWVATDPSTVPPAWCDDMVTWMREQLADGSMSGMMLWSTPSAMRNACRQWAATSPGFDADRCDDMVAWMTQRTGSWNGWMMHGNGMMRFR